ncbi:hypothetical protein MASR1M42_21000 [Azonexus hydrophilus]
MLFNRVTAQAGSSPLLQSMVEALEARGFNVATAFGYPSEIPARQFFIDHHGKSRVAAVVALALKMGSVPEKAIRSCSNSTPVINAISLYNQTRAEWEASPIGLSLTERSWQISGPEFAGAIAPTVVAAKERLRDAETGLDYVNSADPGAHGPPGRPGQEMGDATLRAQPEQAGRSDLLQLPAGQGNIGASYLNVLPRSLWQILGRLEQEGYNARGRPPTEDALFDTLREHGTNIGNWAPGALEKLVRGGNAMLLPVADYRKWFDQQPKELREAMVKPGANPRNRR